MRDVSLNLNLDWEAYATVRPDAADFGVGLYVIAVYCGDWPQAVNCDPLEYDITIRAIPAKDYDALGVATNNPVMASLPLEKDLAAEPDVISWTEFIVPAANTWKTLVVKVPSRWR